MDTTSKIEALKAYLRELAEKDVAVAFSGGVDSSLLLYLCCEAARQTGSKIYAITLQTHLHPHGDVEIAKQVANETGAEHWVFHQTGAIAVNAVCSKNCWKEPGRWE